MAMSPLGQDSMAAAPMGADAETDDGGYEIRIKVSGDGKLSVCVENERGEAPESAEGPEGAEGSGADPTENEDAEMSPYMPAKDIKAALTMALAIFKADGDASAAGAGKAASDGFQAGYAED